MKKQTLPPGFTTSMDAEELQRLRAKLYESERVLRQTSDPWAALRVLGIVAEKGICDAVGRRGRSQRERERLADLFVNMTTAPGPCRPHYARTPERLDLLFAHSAAVSAAQREGRSIPPLASEAVFAPDRDVPMPAEDALRNVARYMGGRSRAQTWKVLNDESRRRKKAGLPRLALPKRVVPADPSWDDISTD